MDTKYKLAGRLKINAYKVVPCEVQLHISTLEDDPWAKQFGKAKKKYPENEYIDGVRTVGELSFVDQNSSPMKINKGTGAGLSEVCEVDLFYEDEPKITSRVEIVFLERTASHRVVGNMHETKHYWQFMVHKVPVTDGLNLFPPDYTGSNQLKVYTCRDFRGMYLGASAVVVAMNAKEARVLLEKELAAKGLTVEGDGNFSIVRVDTAKSGCVILHDGSY